MATDFCKRCGYRIDREAVQRELRRRTGDIPETCNRAADSSVFCGLTCALEDFATGMARETP